MHLVFGSSLYTDSTTKRVRVHWEAGDSVVQDAARSLVKCLSSRGGLIQIPNVPVFRRVRSCPRSSHTRSVWTVDADPPPLMSADIQLIVGKNCSTTEYLMVPFASLFLTSDFLFPTAFNLSLSPPLAQWTRMQSPPDGGLLECHRACALAKRATNH